MKLDPTINRAEIETLLKQQSELVYGTDRTIELAGQIEHLSIMLEEIARRGLDLTAAPPDTSGIPERGSR
jgi:hypothetical protein